MFTELEAAELCRIFLHDCHINGNPMKVKAVEWDGASFFFVTPHSRQEYRPRQGCAVGHIKLQFIKAHASNEES